MRPTSLRVRNYRSFVGETVVELTPGCLGVVGSNGSGKSSLMDAIPFAIFGPEGRSCEPYMAQDADGDLMEVEVELEHAGGRYRIRRGYSARGRGKTTLDVEVLTMTSARDPEGQWDDAGEQWRPLTEATQADTQDALERVLGLSRETFEASAFLGQGKGAQFSEAAPKDRKRLLADVLGLDVWDRAHGGVSADRRLAEHHLDGLDGRIGLLTEQAGDPLEAEIAAKTLALELGVCEEDLEDATVDAQQAAEAVAAVERLEAQREARTAAVSAAAARLQAHERLSVEAQVARERADGVRTEITSLEKLDVERAEVAESIAEMEERERQWDAANARRAALQNEAVDHERLLVRQRSDMDSLEARIVDAKAPGATCDRCGQEMAAAARAEAIRSLEDEHQRAQLRASETRLRIDHARSESDRVEYPAEVSEIVLDAERDRAAELANVPSRLGFARASLASYEEKIAVVDTPEYGETLRDLHAELDGAQDALDALEPTPPLDLLRAAHDHAALRASGVAYERERLRTLKANADAQLQQAERTQADLEAARDQHVVVAADVDQLATLERAFGRDGVPAWIVEQQAIPAIEHEANRILAELGGPVTHVELRTERELKGGGTRDALDIVCVTDAGARDYSSFSGGERTRVDLALRLGLAGLLASRRGADVRFLALDEPSFLDEAGMTALADVLRDLSQRGVYDTIALVSHVPSLRDVFDSSIVVERNGGGSQVTVA